MNQHIESVILQFDIPDGAWTAEPYGNGHINDTYLIAAGEKHFILQRVNGYVFPKPEDVIENIERVTDFLKEQIAREGGDPERETLTLVKTRRERILRMTSRAICGACICLSRMRYPAICRIRRSCSSFAAKLLASSSVRWARFRPIRCTKPSMISTTPRRAIVSCKTRLRAMRPEGWTKCSPEIVFCRQYEQEVRALVDALEQGEIPLRVTHNDTKLNNVLLDSKTGRGVCVIDLDTVMPGLTAYDFGDAIRTGANTAEEDERDLSRVQFSLPMFEAFTRGFLKEAGQTLTAREIELLPMGAKLMTLECGMRFLADHLNGDKYFRVHREGHNLDRARTQFELVRHMEENWQNMADIVRMCAK